MIKFDVFNRWTGAVQFTAEIDCDDNERRSIKLGLAVKWGVKAGADLTGADLTRAVLTRADLTGAVLTGAVLTGAVLTRAVLTRAVLTGADLTGADLTGAVLARADLTGADLTRAVLTRADLTGADLTGADLSNIRADFLAEVLTLPNELEFLRQALLEGKVDGSTYSGECACLAGTLAHARGMRGYQGENIPSNGCTFHAQASSPRERFFLGIKKGDTPETNPLSKIALGWTDEAIAIRDNIRALVVTA